MENIIFEKRGSVALVTINRPKALNALNSQTLSELNEVIGTVEKDDEIYSVVLTEAVKRPS